MGRMMRVLGGGAVAVAGSLAFGATPAQAAGVSCELNFGSVEVSARCSDPAPSGARYRIVLGCSDGRQVVGPWYPMSSGLWSTASCGYGSSPRGGGPQVG